jgi:hypothetical protein
VFEGGAVKIWPPRIRDLTKAKSSFQIQAIKSGSRVAVRKVISGKRAEVARGCVANRKNGHVGSFIFIQSEIEILQEQARG